jgi:hypothetical protein
VQSVQIQKITSKYIFILLLLFKNRIQKDTHSEKFHAEVVVESTWIENEEITNYNVDSNWNPNLFIENSFTTHNEQIAYHLKKEKNKTIVLEIKRIKGKLLSILKYVASN